MEIRKKNKSRLMVTVCGDPLVASRLYHALVGAYWPYVELTRGKNWKCTFVIENCSVKVV